MTPRTPCCSAAAKVAIIYLALGLTWIAASDIAVAMATSQSVSAVMSQGIKGSLFVAVSALVIYLLVHQHLRRVQLAEAHSELVYRQTIGTVTHLVNEHLNTMLYFKMKAETSGAIDTELGRKWEDMLFATAERVRQLGDLNAPTVDALERFLKQARMEGDDEARAAAR